MQRSSRLPGVLPAYLDLAYRLREQISEKFCELFQKFLRELPEILLKLADQAASNTFQTHCLDARQILQSRNEEMVTVFLNELMAGFDRFILGQDEKAKEEIEPDKSRRLSIVEKEVFEVELAFDTIANNACINFGELLFNLNQRLAVINGGFKPDERTPALPGGPHHLCKAYRCALATLTIPLDMGVKICLIEAFDQHVLQQAEPIYQNYNRLLIEANILPNLEDHPVYTIPKGYDPLLSIESSKLEQKSTQSTNEAEISKSQSQSSIPPFEQEETAQKTPQALSLEEEIEREIYKNIRQLLRQRRGKTESASTAARSPLSDLITALNNLRDANNRSVSTDIADSSLEKIRLELQTYFSQLAKLIEQHQLERTDADIIELIGMLFEQMLNDPNLPDSVKALLSHLYTPYLKVALLDRDFFFKRRHPARRLFNLLTQAGTLCNAKEKNEQVVYQRMVEIVNRILTDFDKDLALFEHLFNEFQDFLHKFQRRARLAEKRTIEKAKGQERLREARKEIAKELAQLIHKQPLPKKLEKLLFGPWTNLLVLLYLRHGKNSDILNHYLKETEDLISCVTPRATSKDKINRLHRFSALQSSIKEGLTILGIPANEIDAYLSDLLACHQAALSESVATPHELFIDLDSDNFPLFQYLEEPPKTPSLPNPELENICQKLRSAKLGTWFEFEDQNSGQKIRAKLSWYSRKTGYYIFVNQAGIQVAVKSLKKLANEILEGKAKQLEFDKLPFIERALRRIYSLLRHQ